MFLGIISLRLPPSSANCLNQRIGIVNSGDNYKVFKPYSWCSVGTMNHFNKYDPNIYLSERKNLSRVNSLGISDSLFAIIMKITTDTATTLMEGPKEISSTINFYKFPNIFFNFLDPTISSYSNSLRSIWQGGTHIECGESLCTLSMSLWHIVYLCNVERSRSPQVNFVDSTPYDLFGIIHGHVDMAHIFVNLF